MIRVVRPGGLVAAYMWDMPGGGFPLEPVLAEVRAMGLTHPRPPQAAISRNDALRELWRGVGLDAVRTREITVARTFADFDDFWATALLSPTVRAALPAGASETLAQRLRMRSNPKASVPITLRAHANAIRGQVS